MSGEGKKKKRKRRRRNNKNTHAEIETQILTSTEYNTARRSTGGQTRGREEIKSRNQVSDSVVQSVFTESAKSELANCTSAFAPATATSMGSGKWLRHISGEQHGSGASKRPKSRRSCVRYMCQGSRPSCTTHDVSTALHRVGQEEAH